MRNATVATLGVFVLVVGLTTAHAGSITYSFAGTATGSLNGVAFTDASFTLEALGDTNNIMFCNVGILCNVNISATVAISGFTTAVFTIATQVADNQLNEAIGFELAPFGVDFLAFDNPAFGTYDLSTSIGPTFGDASFANFF